MDNKTDYTNIAAVVADELLSIGAVFLSPLAHVNGLSGLRKTAFDRSSFSESGQAVHMGKRN